MGRFFLRQALESIYIQDYSNLEVVVSDDSKDNEIERECHTWDGKLNIQYLGNPGSRMTASANFNRAIDSCNGTVIKVLCQDDLLSDPTSLSQTVDGLMQGKIWLVSAYSHIDENNVRLGVHIPTWNSRIERKNTIGSHSGLAFLKSQQSQRFDESLFWRMDCELYRRIYQNYGAPYLLLEETVCVRQWSGQSTNSIVLRRDRLREYMTIRKKYPRKVSQL